MQHIEEFLLADKSNKLMHLMFLLLLGFFEQVGILGIVHALCHGHTCSGHVCLWPYARIPPIYLIFMSHI